MSVNDLDQYFILIQKGLLIVSNGYATYLLFKTNKNNKKDK